jgi:putative transposase
VSALVHQSWLESGRVYGYRKVCNDLRDLGERCGKHRVARLMRQAGWKSQTGYTRRPGFRGGKPAVVAPNHLKRAFDVTAPNTVWVSDITYIRTHEGWLYLSVALDLFSRQIVGWSMGERMTRDLAIGALLMAVWRRKPVQEVLVHSDQGSQFSSHDWQQGPSTQAQHEPAWELPRQRRGGELLPTSQARTDQAPDLPDPGRGAG